MDALPPELPPDDGPRDAYDVGAGRKTLRVLAAVIIPPVIAGGVGLMAMLMLAFASDAGARDPDLAGRMFVGVVISIAVFGLCGIPAAFAIVAPPSRRKLWWRTCFGIIALSVLGTIVCAAFYFSAVMK